ncbi:myosin light chain kinase A [Hydra vulgaris]|uniref:myosin light chain kinase A n=1 Tax=Hydra vulgaris TaxID=6087 RepID=UPI0006413CC5|nr:myosin light chain kinase A-like [Hydra vulgaris]
MERKYKIIKTHLLGSGSYANVYLCQKKFSRKKFAAKVIEVNGDNRLRLETENEVEILLELRHHINVVHLVDVIREPSKINIIMEYVDGSSFLAGVFKWPQFDESCAKKTIKQILSALQFCHSKRIVHRDVCPENILWCDVPTQLYPHKKPLLKLIDFNLARKIPDELEFLRSDPLGNSSYMAPECLKEPPIVSFSSDIWSVGIIIFLLLGGYPPFWNKNYNYLLQNILEANYAMPSNLWKGVSNEAQDLIKRTLNKDYRFRGNVDDVLSHSWFNDYKEQSNYVLESPSRLNAFLKNLEEEKKCGKNRVYSLVLEEREPFIPGKEIEFFENIDEGLERLKKCSSYNI